MPGYAVSYRSSWNAASAGTRPLEPRGRADKIGESPTRRRRTTYESALMIAQLRNGLPIWRARRP